MTFRLTLQIARVRPLARSPVHLARYESGNVSADCSVFANGLTRCTLTTERRGSFLMVIVRYHHTSSIFNHVGDRPLPSEPFGYCTTPF
ncbi:hypothetical protein BAUCODRAFT_29972 [Baudoinia panamericana UAMH 10762]|uniref:Uncharacterized protein n=1 Tax=Baudoinia panamericana (strain UAMH 10762) TaxID=717646 RepID=M2LY26_BAUPA|nr:uncharacterized protein BAUCODRAFT_29972 [Baudoinia panamericana UAMH 10762]EMC99602.1 hypothetical protein BAUCODRAFT_29972 [Baudoinia panamericana UAMH 10762]